MFKILKEGSLVLDLLKEMKRKAEKNNGKGLFWKWFNLLKMVFLVYNKFLQYFNNFERVHFTATLKMRVVVG